MSLPVAVLYASVVTGRSTFRLAALAVVAALALAGCSGASGALRNKSGSAAHCRTPASATEWRTLLGTSTEFGLDSLKLHSKSAHPVVTKVDLVDPKGQITLAHIALVPGGGVGTGFPWASSSAESVPGWRLRVELPNAALRYVSGSPSLGANFDGTVWQVAVGVTVSGDGGSAKAVRITYTDGGKTRTINGKARFGVYHTNAMCKAAGVSG
jgi:hypothetical protein